MLREIEFVKYVTHTVRIRHYHLQDKNQVIEFMLQLEASVKEKWYPVIRYDTKHGFAHKDEIHFHDSTEKFNLGMGNYNMAITFAEQDLKNNWHRYIAKFLAEVKDND